MARKISPLRYPGGKSTLYPLFSQIIRLNNIQRMKYAEPFAGGAGLSLLLLFNGHVSSIYINDCDPAVWSFWYSVVTENEKFSKKLIDTDITIEEWKRQREIYLNEDSSVFERGFATFFLNRTNRSGIIKGAGVIGGLNQLGKYKIDCRFNKQELTRIISRIEKYKEMIHVSCQDGREFIKQKGDLFQEQCLFFIDPPYYKKGRELYENFFNHDDHCELAECIKKLSSPWVLTYDESAEIRKIYDNQAPSYVDIYYAIEKKTENE